MSKICHECGQPVPEKKEPAAAVFHGERSDKKWDEIRTETLRTFFAGPPAKPVTVGQVAGHFKCGLNEANYIMDRLKTEGAILEISGEEARRRYDVSFGYLPSSSGLAGR